MNNNTFSPGSFICPPGFTMTVEDDSFHELDGDEELCLIRAPWDFDMSLLHGQKIHLLESVVVQDSNESKFELMPLDNTLTQNISALIPTQEEDQIVQVPQSFKRHFSITEKFSIPNFEAPCTSEDQENNIVIPQGLSQRFIPFGSGFPVVSHKGSKKSKARDREDVLENRKPKDKRHHISSKKNFSVETHESVHFVDDKHTARKKLEMQACEFVSENKKHKRKKSKTSLTKDFSNATDDSSYSTDNKYIERKRPETQTCEFVSENKHRHKKFKTSLKKNSSSARDDSLYSTDKYIERKRPETQTCEFVSENNKKHRHKKPKISLTKDFSNATDDSSHSTDNKNSVRKKLEAQVCEFVSENNKKHSHRKSKKNLCGITCQSPFSVDEKYIKKKIKVEVEI